MNSNVTSDLTALSQCTVPYFTAFMPEEEATVAAGEFRRITEERVEDVRCEGPTQFTYRGITPAHAIAKHA